MISIVCVYNNKKVFNDFLSKSLQDQTVQFELVAIDNSTGEFSSAAQALNYGARQTKSGSKYIMFVHQDIDFCSSTFLEETENVLNAIPNLGIAGVAGNSPEEKKLISNIKHGTPPIDAGRKIEKPTSAMTVDECCAIVPRQVFEKYQLDAEVCDGWHLYVVEYCLRIKELGLGVYVLPSIVYHGSLGVQDGTYFKALNKVLRRHTQGYTKIHTTCGRWNTRIPVQLQMVWFYIRKAFYATTNALIAWGLVPEWMQKKKMRRLRESREKTQ